MRVLKTVSIVIGSFIFSVIISFVASLALGGSDSAQQTAGGLTYIAMFAYWGFLATKVGYRWWDFLFGIIPFYGAFWVFRIAYRIAFLPNCDWSLRDTEQA